MSLLHGAGGLPALSSPPEPSRFVSELELLLAAGRLAMTTADQAAATAALERGIDWARLSVLAQRHGVLPLVHTHIASGAIDAAHVPAGVRDHLARGASAIARRNLRVATELVAIIRDLDAHGIAAMPLKGPVLAAQAYGSISLRKIGDLDVLCGADQVENAIERLRGRGYLRTETRPDQQAAELRMTHHVALCDPSTRMRVELHSRLFSRRDGPRVELSTIANRLEHFPFHGTRVSVFCAEDLLVYLCIHGAAHAWERLEWLCGVAELLRAGQVRDWSRVAAWADRLDAMRRVSLGMHLAHTLLHAPVPADMASPSRPTLTAARRITAKLERNPVGRATAGELLALGLRMEASVSARIARYWAECVVPTPADLAAIPLPPAFWRLYYVLRPIRISVRFVANRLRRAFEGGRQS